MAGVESDTPECNDFACIRRDHMVTPKNGYAFRHRQTGNVALAIFLGKWDSIDNYEEITEEEYKEIMLEKERNMAKEREMF